MVNLVNLIALFPRQVHPHGIDEARFVELFSDNKPIVFVLETEEVGKLDGKTSTEGVILWCTAALWWGRE